MALTDFGVNSPMTAKVWSQALLEEALRETYVSRFIAKDSNALITRRDELQRMEGDRVRIGLRMQLNGAGILGDGTLEGSEEHLTTYADDILVDQLRHAVRSAGRMSEQRTAFETRQEALHGLRDWFADRLDTAFFNQVCGYTPEDDTRFTGLQPVVAPDSDHIIRAGTATADEALADTATDSFSLSLIDRCVERAKTLSPNIRPVKLKGGEYYVMFLHPYQVTDLRTATNTGQWLDIQKAALAGGEVVNNPIFTGALGVYNNTILHESTRIPQGVVSTDATAPVADTRRAVFCGAQAAGIAFAGDGGPRAVRWVEESFDYGNQLGVSAGLLFGLKKLVFDGSDFATIVCTTAAKAHG